MNFSFNIILIRIIVETNLNSIRVNTNKLLEKINKVDPTAKMVFKKGISEIADLTCLIETQIKYTISKGKIFCDLDELLYKLLSNLISKYQVIIE